MYYRPPLSTVTTYSTRPIFRKLHIWYFNETFCHLPITWNWKQNRPSIWKPKCLYKLSPWLIFIIECILWGICRSWRNSWASTKPFVSSRIDIFRDISTLKLSTYDISKKDDCTSVAGARTNLTVCNKAFSVSHAALSNLTCTEYNRAKALRALN